MSGVSNATYCFAGITSGSNGHAKSPRSSAISFECHVGLFFEELYKSFESELRGEKDSSRKCCETDDKNITQGSYDRDSSDSECFSGLCQSQQKSSELTKGVNSIIEDKSVSIVKKFEARIIDREVRAGSRLFRTLCEGSFASASIAGRVARLASEPAKQIFRTLSDAASASSSMLSELAYASSSLVSISGRVARSASEAILSSRNINGLRKKSSAAGQNETFSYSSFPGTQSAGALIKNGKASDAGYALLGDSGFQRSKGSRMKRMGGSSKVASRQACSSSMAPNIKEELSSANFMKLLNKGDQEQL